MANKNCEACSELQENSADFVQNGVTKDICNSLKANTGFNQSSGHDDCEDLSDANDCLIGNMEDSIDAYDMCSWKTYTKDLVHNLWNVLKAIICSICGLWTRVEKHDCEIKYLTNGTSFKFGEGSDGQSYIVAGQGVTFLEDSSTQFTSDVALLYIAGGLLRFQGTFRFHNSSNFNDPVKCYNFDNDGKGNNYSSSRSKNSVWGTTGALTGGGEIICQLRIKKSEFPEIKNIYAGIGAPTGGGAYQVNLTVSNEGDEWRGQHGTDSSTYTVPSGWMYVTARMINIMAPLSENTHYSPRGFMGIRVNRNGIECD